MSEENKKVKKEETNKIHYVLLGLLLFLIAVIRGVEYLINQGVLKLDENMSFNKFIFQLAENMTKSWIPFTIILLVLFISYIFRQIYNGKTISGKYITALLLAANLALIGKWYQSESVSRNLEQLKTKWYLFVGLLLLTVLGYFAFDLIKKNSVRKEIKKEIIESAIQNSSDAFGINYRKVIEEQETYKIQMKNAKNKNKIEIKEKRHQKKLEKIKDNQYSFSFVLGILIVLIIIIVVFIGFIRLGGFKPLQVVFDYIEKLFGFTNLTSLNPDDIHEKIEFNEFLSEALNLYLLSLGYIFSSLIIIFFIIFVAYLFVRLFIYFFKNTSEDYKPIKRFAQEFKVFFYDSANSVTTFLLFIPNFLNEMQYFLFGENHIRGRIRHTLGDKEDIEENNCKSDEEEKNNE